jgi:hypothetical protein
MESRTLSAFVRSVYGRQTIYPACDNAQTIAKLANQKTLTQRELTLAKALGFTVVQVADPEVRW